MVNKKRKIIDGFYFTGCRPQYLTRRLLLLRAVARITRRDGSFFMGLDGAGLGIDRYAALGLTGGMAMARAAEMSEYFSFKYFIMH